MVRMQRIVAMNSRSANEESLDPQVTQAEDSPQLVSALKAHAAVTREQKSTLARVLEGFIHVLRSSSDTARRVITADAWDGHAGWIDEEWVAWRTWMWYKHFCRAVRTIYSVARMLNDQTLFTVLAVPPQFCHDSNSRLIFISRNCNR